MGKEDYKNEKKGHGFLCVPKELLFDNRYKQLTIEAILLYAYMLDRLKLSIENGWKDSDGKVFIYFSLESIMDLLKCSKGKAISTLKELDEKHGIGLIEKKRSGYGKCSRIYVKEIFELSVSENEKTREKNEEDLEVTNKKHEKSKNKMSRSSKIEPIEVKKINPNNTNKSNTNKSNTKSNHIFRKDMEEKITIEQQIRTNIDYDSLLLTHREDVEQIDEIVNLISEILAKGDKRKIYIAGDMLDCEYVKERFRELNNKHIRWAFPSIVIALSWKWILNGVSGFIPNILVQLGICNELPQFLSDNSFVFLTLIFINIWFGAPMIMVNVLSALQTIPQDQYEAAQIDGASKVQQFWYITVPHIKVVVGLLVVLRTIWVFNNFDIIYLLTGGGPANATTTMPIYAYNMGWNTKLLGRSSAVTMLLLAFLLLVCVIYFTIIGKWEKEDK